MQKVARLLAQVSNQFVALSSVVFIAFAFETFFPTASEKVDAKLSALLMIVAAWFKST